MRNEKYRAIGGVLPGRLRRDVFEPAFSDALVEFWGKRYACKSRLSIARQELRFATQIGVIVLQCWWLAIKDLLVRVPRNRKGRVSDTHSHLSKTANNEAFTSPRNNISDSILMGPPFPRSEKQKMSTVNRSQHQGENHDSRRGARFAWLSDVHQDLRYGLRVLLKSLAFAAITVLTLALGIGANTSIFSLIDSLMLKSLPVRDPAHLFLLEWRARKKPQTHNSHSYGDCVETYTQLNVSGCSFSEPFLNDVRKKAKVFSEIAEFAGGTRFNLSGNGPSTLVSSQYVSGDYFQTLGVNPAIGRVIQRSDDSTSSSAVLVLRYGYWKSAFGGDPGVVGRTVHLDGYPFTIAGVAEANYIGLTPGSVYDIWIPIAQRPHVETYLSQRTEDAGSWWIVAVGRLAPGVSREAAQNTLSEIFHNDLVNGDTLIAKPEDAPFVKLESAQTALVGARGRLSTTFYLLMTAVGAVLLIACANVAGLMLARTASREKEIAVRLAIGASRGRILRQLLTESLTIALAGGVLGIALAYWSAHGLLAFLGSTSPRPLGITADLDVRVLAFTLAVSLMAGIFFGITPALRSTQVSVVHGLKQGASHNTLMGSKRGWFIGGNSLVIAQVALTVVVLVGTGLLVRTLQNLRNIDLGFSSENLLTFGVDSAPTGYGGVRQLEFYNVLRERFAAIPSVLSVGYSAVPLLSGNYSTIRFNLPGRDPATMYDAEHLLTGPKFFDTMHIALVSGRDFTASEYESAAKATERTAFSTAARPVIVNEMFVTRYLPNVYPIDKSFGQDSDQTYEKFLREVPNYHRNPGWFIVGVVHDSKFDSLRREVQPTIYEPCGEGGYFELRTATNPQSVMPEIQRVVQQVDSDLPIFDVKTESSQIDDLLFEERLVVNVGSCFAILALLLACIGLYGLLSYEVSRSTKEIGIRMALGAQAGIVLRSVIQGGIVLVSIGTAIGLAVSYGLTRYLGSILFDVKPGDPFTLVVATVLLLVVAAVACFIPARRATRVDPLVALRSE